MVIGFYMGGFIISSIMTVVIFLRNKKLDTLFGFFAVFATINCFGRLMISLSSTVDMGILANKVLYAGGIFTPILLTLILIRLCEVSLPKWATVSFVGYGVLVYAAVLTIGHTTWYYKDIDVAMHPDGYYYLVKSYGPLHIMYPILMIICVVILMSLIIYAMVRSRNIPSRIVGQVSFLGIATIMCYILERALHSTVEWVSISYLIACAIMIVLSNRMEMYDMSANIYNAVDKLKEYGYIVFDKKLRYIKSNDLAEELFPEIKDWIPDNEVKPEDSRVYNEIVSQIVEWSKSKEEKTFEIGDKFVTITIHNIYYRSSYSVGYLVEIIDKTVETKYLKTIEGYNENLEREVMEKTKRIVDMKDSILLGMAVIVESRDNSTGGHIKRTSDVVKIFARHLVTADCKYEMSEQFLRNVTIAAPLHDVGKVAVDDRILRKQGLYEPEEFEQMKVHPAEGGKLVERVLAGYDDKEFVSIARNIAHYHHEKWNGKGYPEGLAGEQIPLEARIMAFADVFDALVSKRCYKEAFSHERAFEIIKEDMGTHFDPELGKVFLMCREELEELYEGYGQ